MCAGKSAYFFTDTAISSLAMPPIPPLESLRMLKYCRDNLEEACHPRRESLSPRNLGWPRFLEANTIHSSPQFARPHTYMPMFCTVEPKDC